MPGFSLTLLLLPANNAQAPVHTREQLLALLDEKSPGSKWRWGYENSALASITHSAGTAVANAGLIGERVIKETSSPKILFPCADYIVFQVVSC